MRSERKERKEPAFSMKTIQEIDARFADHSPWVDPAPARVEAGVAAVVREGSEGLELLFIRRADHDDDPWSGDLAFPGGRIDPGDDGAQGAAVRETLEEIGLDLRPARYLGRLSDVLGSAESIRVSAFVYSIEGDPVLTPNYEVREAFWSPFSHFTDPARQEWREFEYQNQKARLPAIRLLEDPRAPVLWGITYKFLDHLMEAIGEPIPFMPWEDGSPS